MLSSIKNIYHKANIYRNQLFIQWRGHFLSLFAKLEKQHEPIDFVVTWVDGNDPVWQNEKSKYSMLQRRRNTADACRYRDWNIFKYWFRAVEMYAPWVRNVYLVTYGHVPDWINMDHPKLHVIRHDEYMDGNYLPTFSSIPIELNLHRIEGLSEHFVYFNDDMLLASPVEPEHFFQGGLPVLTAIAKPLKNNAENTPFVHQLFSVAGLINSRFYPSQFMRQFPEKWFSACYGSDRKFNARTLTDDYCAGLYFSHLASPFRKSTMQKVWEEYFEQLDSTCKNRFRTHSDIMHQIFTAWELVTGQFVPTAPGNQGIIFTRLDQAQDISHAFSSQKYAVICLNDNEAVEYCEQTKKNLEWALESCFPRKSSFEK